MEVFHVPPVYDRLTMQARALARLCIATHGADEKIRCIKSFREVSDAGLRDAKDAIYAVLDHDRNHRGTFAPEETLGDILRATLDNCD